MKKIKLVFALVIGFQLFASKPALAQMSYLDVGTEVDKYPQVKWLKGDSVTKFDKSKIYVIELWATWCIPCIANMPHINSLAKKFKGKIIFIGQDVMENDTAKVLNFVKNKGDGMDYSIAFAGSKGSSFEKKWLNPAGVSSIPQTFIIQDNKLVWQTTPLSLNEEILQLLIDRKFSIKAAHDILDRKKQ